MRQSDVKGHSFTPKDEKKISVLLRNVCSSYNVEDIAFGINDYEIDVVIANIEKFNTARSADTTFKPTIWRITLEPGSDVGALLSKKHINQLNGVRYERLRSSGVTQCYNCQQFGHAASNCFRDFRCVKCDINHPQGNCPTDHSMDEATTRPEPKCVNCGKTGHPANYRGCQVHLDLLKRLEDKKRLLQEAQVARQNYYNNFRKPEVSFANVMGPKVSNQRMTPQQVPAQQANRNNNAGVGFDIQAECRSQFGMDFRSIRQKLSDFSPIYASVDDKALALIQFIASIHPDYQ